MLRMDNSKNKIKTCFVISPIGATDSPQRKRADMVLKHIFKPALEPLRYLVIRADEISTPGSITLQILERVLESTIVIADLTDHNPNVFYELAVRHATQLPVIHVISSGQSIPFDVADLRTISMDLDLDGAEKARSNIVAQVKEIEAGRLGETPVKLAGVLKHLTTGQSEDKLILLQILGALNEMRTEIRTISKSNTASQQQTARQIPSTAEYLYNHPYMDKARKRLKKKLPLGDSVKTLDVSESDATCLFRLETTNGLAAESTFKRTLNPLPIHIIISGLMSTLGPRDSEHESGKAK